MNRNFAQAFDAFENSKENYLYTAQILLFIYLSKK